METQNVKNVRTLVNGKSQDYISVHDRGVQFGDGVFETIRVNAGTLQLWQYHINRMLQGCNQLRISPPDVALILRECRMLISEDKNGVLKIIITRGLSQRGYKAPTHKQSNRVVYWYPDSDGSSATLPESVALRFCQTVLAKNTALAGIKHLNRLEQILARTEWDEPLIFDGIMCDTDGNAIECTASNLFIGVDKILSTPDLTHCGIAGVVRQWIIDLAKELQKEYGITLLVQKISKAQLLSADEVFIANSIIGIQPVKQIDQQNFNIGRITQLLKQKFASISG